MRSKIPISLRINPVVIIFGTILLVIIPFFIWSSLAEIDQISHAQGQVIASAKTQQIQSANDGVVEKLYVHEGSYVKKGETLVLLDPTQPQASYDDSLAKVAALEATLSRLHAEIYAKPLSFSKLSEQYPEFVQNQTELFHRRKKALNDEISALQEALHLSQEELNLNLPLLEKGDIGTVEIIRIKRQIADLKGQISNKRNKYFQDSQTEMTKAEEDLSTKEQELADHKVTLQRTIVTAPMDGIVKNIVMNTQGARVRPGDILLELVPSNDNLIIEAKMSPSDISFVKTEQHAAVKLDAYDYSIYGIFHGEVVYISPDTLNEKTPEGEKSYFRVHIKLKKHEIISKSGKVIEITPGMTAQVDIITGQRTVLEYLTKPMIKTLSESFHER